MIALRSVRKQLHGRDILSDVNLPLGPAATHVLLGSSGSGKTALLRIIAGMLAPDGGEVRGDGRR